MASMRIGLFVPWMFTFPAAELVGQNLVPNPGFEDLTMCPGDASSVYLAAPWISPTMGSTDLFNTCAGSSCDTGPPWVCVPLNWTGEQMPHTGQGYAGFFVTWSGEEDYREYVQAELTEPLVAGTAYTVSFHVSLADDGNMATSSIGAHLSMDPITLSGTTPLVCCPAQIMAEEIITDKENWTLITGCYTATGGERYITIGNFNLWQDSPNEQVTGGNTDHGFYYLDDVSVTEGGSVTGGIFGDDVVICEGDSVVIDLTAPNTTVVWQDGSQDLVRVITEGGTYWVDLTSACGTLSDTLFVASIAELVVDIGPDTGFCSGGSVLLDATTPGAQGYQWMGQVGTSTYLVSVPGPYWVEVGSACGSVSDSVTVYLEQPPVIDIGSDTLLCTGDVLVLDATTDGAGYVWQDGTGAATLAVAVPGTYWVEVSAPCIASDTITVMFDPCELIIAMPNVFSPNGDLFNGSFRPLVMENVASAVLEIYDRWGLSLHRTTDLERGWNGTVSGAKCAEGTYYWILHVTNAAGRTERSSGYLTLLR